MPFTFDIDPVRAVLPARRPVVFLGLKTAQWIGLGIGATEVAIFVAIVIRGTSRSAISMEGTQS